VSRFNLRVRVRHAVGLSCLLIAGLLAGCDGGGLVGIEFTPRPVTWLALGEQGATIENLSGSNISFSSIHTTNEAVFKKVSTTCVSPLKPLTPCGVKIKLEGTFKKGLREELIIENAAGEKASDLLVTE